MGKLFGFREAEDGRDATFSARWEQFREDVRSNAENIREGCIACSGNGEQEVA